MTKIYLIRHGESVANVDEHEYLRKFDHNIELTEKGKQQAKDAGKKLKQLLLKDIENKKIQGSSPDMKFVKSFHIICSPYKRTIQTWDEINKQFNEGSKKLIADKAALDSGSLGEFEESPLLREQEHKVFKDLHDSKTKKDEQANFGKFWYRFKNAESIADVYQRVAIFLNSVQMRHIQRDVSESVVIIAHEITINMLLMHLFKKETHNYPTTVGNCEIIEVETSSFMRGTKLTRH